MSYERSNSEARNEAILVTSLMMMNYSEVPPPALRAISKGPALRRETWVVSRPALHGGAVDGGILAISGDETRLFAPEQRGVLAALLVLMRACQFGHGVGGFATSLIHSGVLAARYRKPETGVPN